MKCFKKEHLLFFILEMDNFRYKNKIFYLFLEIVGKNIVMSNNVRMIKMIFMRES